MIFLAIDNEVRKRFLIMWDYRFNLFLETVLFIFIFLAMGLIKGDGVIDPTGAAPTLLGYMMWYCSYVMVFDMNRNMAYEVQHGTLEQMYMSPVPITLLTFAWSIAALIKCALFVGLMGGFLIVVVSIKIPWNWDAALITLVTVVGLYGFGFICLGLTLVFKQTSAIVGLYQNMLLFLNGSIMSVERFPGWIESFANTLPTTQGTSLLNRVLLGDDDIYSIWQDGTLFSLAVNSLVYLVVGVFIFAYCEYWAKKQGSLGIY